MEVYQNFGEGGDSDSALKLRQLRLPDLKGKRVLDIGCNAGFFCIEAVKAGAASAVGIEARADFHALAMDNAGKAGIDMAGGKCLFINGTWRDVVPSLDGVFDVVLWLSAMHYEPDPRSLAFDLAGKLADGGTLVLECGIGPNVLGNDWTRLPRPGMMDSYPSISMLHRIFDMFHTRDVGPSTALPGQGDRRVFHLSKRKPVVMLVSSGRGKSWIAKSLSGMAVCLNVDSLLHSLDNPGHRGPLESFVGIHGPLLEHQVLLREWFSKNPGDADWLADHICHYVNKSSHFFVVEGGVLASDVLAGSIAGKLGDGYVVWEAKRRLT